MGDITQEQLDAEKRRAEEALRRAEEAEAKAEEAEEARAAAESAAEAVRSEQAKAQAQEAIAVAIRESGLPEPSQKYLRESLSDVADVEAARAAIESHKGYVASLTGKGEVRGNGGGEGGGSATRSLSESLQRLGLTAEQAAIAEKGA